MLQNIKPIRNPIGAETIYIEAQQAAIDILTEFGKHEVCPLLISHPQQGKTAVQIAVVDSFIETCKANNETYQVILILNMSDNSLLAQTKSRFREAGLMLSEIDFYHHPSLNWSNYGKYDTRTWKDNDQSTWAWQVDHIIPQSSLPYTSMEDDNFKKCWVLENLRPLSSKQNVIDGITGIRHGKKNK
jgi:hypothetical protein